MDSNMEQLIVSKYGQFIIKKIMIYITNRKLRMNLHNCMSENFFKFLYNENGIRGLHDFLEHLSDVKRLQFLEERFE